MINRDKHRVRRKMKRPLKKHRDVRKTNCGYGKDIPLSTSRQLVAPLVGRNEGNICDCCIKAVFPGETDQDGNGLGGKWKALGIKGLKDSAVLKNA